MIVDSLHEVGAARSIVIDENGRVLAGNGTVTAAAEVGIERVQIVDADGDTLVAVRRSGLTEEQKVRLGLLDNRTADLAQWDAHVLAGLADDGVEIGDLFDPVELEALLSAEGEPDWADSIGGLPDGEKSPFQQMTITVTNAQAEVVQEAFKQAKAKGDFGNTGNENSNGNALARVCESYVR